MTVRVECRPGPQGEPEPHALWLGERRIAVRAVVDRWFDARRRWVKVEADDGDTYVLRHDAATGDWQLAAYRRGAR